MAGDIDWKKKYQELKSKFMESVDMAFRLGFEQGKQQAGQDQAMQAQNQANSMPGGANGGESPDPTQANGPTQPGDDQSSPMPGGATPNEPPNPAVPMAESEHPDGSELDQHISKLESMLGKSEDLDLNDLKKTVDDLKSLQKSYKEQLNLKKSAQAISGIAKALHKPAFKISQQAQHNLNSNAKQSLSMQEKIVNDIMKKMEQEESRASKNILAQLGVEGLTKGE